MESTDQVVKAPKSSTQTQVEQLGYVESFDAVIDRDYAFVVYKETNSASGQWVVKIKSACTAGTVLDPGNSAFKAAIKKAAGHDQPHLVWGFNLLPKENDPRMVENRVLIGEDGKPLALEIHLVTRKADSSAREKKLISVDWPG